MVIYHGFNLCEGVGLGPLLQSGQIQGRQQLTSLKVAGPGYFCGKSETYTANVLPGNNPGNDSVNNPARTLTGHIHSNDSAGKTRDFLCKGP